MKRPVYFLLIVAWILAGCYQATNKAGIQQRFDVTGQEKETITSDACLARVDAEKILGQTAKLTQHSSENRDGIVKVRCTYTANVLSAETNRTSNLYYLLEEYKDVALSQKVYADILKQNETMPGLEQLNKIGDEAFLHTDNKNFLLIVSRKANKLIRLKVNKITSLTSLTELQNSLRVITAAL